MVSTCVVGCCIFLKDFRVNESRSFSKITKKLAVVVDHRVEFLVFEFEERSMIILMIILMIIHKLLIII